MSKHETVADRRNAFDKETQDTYQKAVFCCLNEDINTIEVVSDPHYSQIHQITNMARYSLMYKKVQANGGTMLFAIEQTIKNDNIIVSDRYKNSLCGEEKHKIYEVCTLSETQLMYVLSLAVEADLKSLSDFALSTHFV